MDTFAHGLWTAALYRAALPKVRKRTIVLAAFWGIVPDIFSFGIWTTTLILTGGFFKQLGSPPDYATVPAYVSVLYNWTHSLIVFAVVFGIIWAFRKRAPWIMLGWPVHILTDMPTHTSEFFATPFLWPLSDVSISGMSWGEPWFMALNYGALLSIWTWLFLRHRRLAKLIRTSGK